MHLLFLIPAKKKYLQQYKEMGFILNRWFLLVQREEQKLQKKTYLESVVIEINHLALLAREMPTRASVTYLVRDTRWT